MLFFSEEQAKPADLSAPIVFQKPVKRGPSDKEDDQGSSKKSWDRKDKRNKKLKTTHLLSFDEDHEEEN